ncbi:hypothetical protein [Paenibacillus sp. LHD-38]|uniref:hypothetical protein n=1 Tax=Paenibacillus sp. LHD-38 TaxID=3072143 RepID=UPI00280F8410|nr:hypothetical protein [Paenibacillus sp. LHD-38]MDQ8734391.1 hypothetical protein [Paenibacillus sp. LHD-38]
MIRMRRAAFILLLTAEMLLTACSNKPYGHYRDDQMIGFIDTLNEQEQIVGFNISEWSKRDEPGPDIADWGAGYEARVLPSTKITNEAGEKLSWEDLKQGQKVQINPSKTEKKTETPDELIILTMPNEELLARAGLLASKNGSYKTTVVYEKGKPQPYPVEEIEKDASIVLNGGYGWMEHNPGYVMDVKKAFSLEALPVFLVFDTEKLVLKTERLEEAAAFISSMEK